MPALSIPPDLKRITQFVRRAEELDRDVTRPESRLVAYYCRQHAVRTGIALSNSSAATKCLGEILTALESEKEPMSVFSEAESRLICRNFAMGVFDRADAEDRAGNSSKVTAKTFYAAAVFLEILRHFDEGDVDGETERTESQQEEDKKRVYSKWKATEILKAIKEGREIVPGGYNEQATEDGDDDDDKGETTVENGVAAPDAVIPVPPTGSPRPPSPSPSLPSVPLAPPNNDDDDYDDLPKDQGTEVELDPPPPPPPVAPPLDPPPAYDDDVVADAPPPPAAWDRPPANAPASAPVPKKSSMFSAFGRKKSSKRSATAVADAVELTRFALAALESNDVDLGATRLEQALRALSR